MPTVSVPVLKPLDHQGRSYVRGDTITVSIVDAVSLAKRRLVSLTVGAKVTREAEAVAEAPLEPEHVAEADAVDEPRPRRQYRRRDVTPSPGATYERRDLTAEPTE